MESWSSSRAASSGGVLALLVGGQRGQVALELGELELGVVETLGGLLGLVEEPVDARLDVVDVRLGLRGRGGAEAERRERARYPRGP